MGKKVVITPGLDKCLWVFTLKEWEKISGKLSESSVLTADNRSFNRFLFGGAVDTEVDALGRVLVPDFLKGRADLQTKVAIVGVQNRVEIWNEEAWQKYRQVVEKQADALAEKLGGMGMF